MAIPCREQVVAALVGQLVAAGLTVERDRTVPVTAAELGRAIVYEGSEEMTPDFSGEDGFELQVDVEGYAAAAGLAELRGRVDAAVLADRTLGGIARDVDIVNEAAPERLELDQAASAKGFVRSYRVLYATAEGDPFTFA